MEMDYQEIKTYLSHIPQYMDGTAVERMGKLLDALGRPDRNLKVIHIAGSNGKGSVCAYISSIIESANHTAGLFISPHLLSIRERIQLNRKNISREDFTACFHTVCQTVRKHHLQLAYFEYFLGTAILFFSEKKAEYIIMETGLGGRLDATNAVMGKICCVITALGLEHTAVLGDTIEKIAAEKAGIMRTGVPVVYQKCGSNSDSVIEKIAQQHHAYCYGVDDNQFKVVKNLNGCIDFLIDNEYYSNDCFQISANAFYQARNAAVALTACKVMEHFGLIQLDRQSMHHALKAVFWPGRMEKLRDGFYVDGAHNPQGIDAFVRAVHDMHQYGNWDKAALLFSVVSDKDYKQMIEILCGCTCFKRIVITVIGGARKLDKDKIYRTFKQYTDLCVETYDSVPEALEALEGERMVFAAGSLYLVSEIMKG